MLSRPFLSTTHVSAASPRQSVPKKTRAGFTLVELAVVVVIIGVLAAFGVPRLLQSVERSKAAESFAYLTAVRSAQERFHAKEGLFADDMAKLDVQMPAPKYFTVGTPAAGTSGMQTSWTLALTRAGSSAGYGAYTVVFNQDGFDSKTSTITAEISPMQ